MYISHTINPLLRNLNTDFTLVNCLFSSVELTGNADLDKYKYSSNNQDLILVENFYLKMLLFLELIRAHLCILMIREKIP